jgi:PLP dependent protein
MLSNPQNSPALNTLATRHAAVRERIVISAAAADRDVHSVTVLAVSKGQSADQIRLAMQLGLTDFGENYVTEALGKIRILRDTGATWHFIGRLQANKTRSVAENFAWVHSVDREQIATRLAAQRPALAPPLNVCVQVRIANDPQKGGVAPEEAMALLKFVAQQPRLRLRGLMCMLPFGIDRTQQHARFAALRQLYEMARSSGLALDTLSMGMSADLEVAIAEGSTMVRVGTALFGERPTTMHE